MREYTVVLEPADEGGFVAVIPALQGCATQGEDEQEALRSAKEVIEIMCEAMRQHGEAVPYDVVSVNLADFVPGSVIRKVQANV